jgi:hypothetical protein
MTQASTTREPADAGRTIPVILDARRAPVDPSLHQADLAAMDAFTEAFLPHVRQFLQQAHAARQRVDGVRAQLTAEASAGKITPVGVSNGVAEATGDEIRDTIERSHDLVAELVAAATVYVDALKVAAVKFIAADPDAPVSLS